MGSDPSELRNQVSAGRAPVEVLEHSRSVALAEVSLGERIELYRIRAHRERADP